MFRAERDSAGTAESADWRRAYGRIGHGGAFYSRARPAQAVTDRTPDERRAADAQRVQATMRGDRRSARVAAQSLRIDRQACAIGLGALPCYSARLADAAAEEETRFGGTHLVEARRMPTILDRIAPASVGCRPRR